jgi:hypothetical protein
MELSLKYNNTPIQQKGHEYCVIMYMFQNNLLVHQYHSLSDSSETITVASPSSKMSQSSFNVFREHEYRCPKFFVELKQPYFLQHTQFYVQMNFTQQNHLLPE